MRLDYKVIIDAKCSIQLCICEAEASFIQLFLDTCMQRNLDLKTLDISLQKKGIDIFYVADCVEDGVLLTIPNVGNDIVLQYVINDKVEVGSRGKVVVKNEKGFFFAWFRYIFFLPVEDVNECEINIDFVWKNGWVGNKRNYSCNLQEIFGLFVVAGENIKEYNCRDPFARLFIDNTICNMSVEKVFEAMHYIAKYSKISIPSNAVITCAILRDNDIHGGMAQEYSFISEPDLLIVFHEIVHIWLGNIIKVCSECTWLKEGLAEYLSIKLHHILGVSDKYSIMNLIEKKYHCIEEINEYMRFDLSEFSKLRTETHYEIGVYNVVYQGGMLLCMLLDYYLLQKGNRIEELITKLYYQNVEIDMVAFENVINALIDEDKCEEINNIINGKQRLPDCSFLLESIDLWE